jgi:hypothetical protein
MGALGSGGKSRRADPDRVAPPSAEARSYSRAEGLARRFSDGEGRAFGDSMDFFDADRSLIISDVMADRQHGRDG